jgi:translation initiation factor 1A
LGKRKVVSEEVIHDMVLPTANDVLGIAVKLLGFDRIMVKCQDGRERLCRIRGKMKRRVWIREGDIIWRYTRGQADWLRKNGYITI